MLRMYLYKYILTSCNSKICHQLIFLLGNLRYAACFFSHRPTFYFFSWHTSVLGFVGSIVMMFAINPGASGIAIISMLLILIGLHYRAPMPASWGSISQALIFHQVCIEFPKMYIIHII